MSGQSESCDKKSQPGNTDTHYHVFLERFSVRGSHSVAHNKTHAGNVASGGSQNLIYKVYYENMLTTRASGIFFGIKHFK